MAKKENVHAAASGGGGAVYCLGLIGAFVYFMQQANNFWEVLVGIFQAFVWPAYLVYKAFEAIYG